MPARNEQRSHSSLSRSQQRIIGAYGSRIAGGSGIIADSMEGSGNSMEESQKHPTNNPENLPVSTSVQSTTRSNSVRSGHAKEIRNSNDIQSTKNNLRSSTSGHYKNSIRRNQEASWTKRTRYKNVNNVDSSEKKWWRFLKWLPGLKVNESGNPHEELSMTTWNIRDNEQCPV